MCSLFFQAFVLLFEATNPFGDLYLENDLKSVNGVDEALRELLNNEKEVYISPSDNILRRCRKVAGITCKVAARRLMISLRQYKRYEFGRIEKIPDRVLLLVLLGVLEKDYDMEEIKILLWKRVST